MELERLFVQLGYTFKEQELLMTALTHSSYANERGLGRGACNERLEFLGDSVLGYLTAEHLFSGYKDKSEGELTKLRSALVCEASLCEAAKRLNLGDALRMGKGEVQTGGRERSSILADAFEAVLAAIYLDGGKTAASAFVKTNVLDNGDVISEPGSGDYKTRLQELLQREAPVSPEYHITNEVGPDHEKVFTAEVMWRGKLLGSGDGRSKKEAEQSAAKSALARD
jgi:ribonuclease-3